MLRVISHRYKNIDLITRQATNSGQPITYIILMFLPLYQAINRYLILTCDIIHALNKMCNKPNK